MRRRFVHGSAANCTIFVRYLARVACYEFVSGIGTQGDYRAVYFIKTSGGGGGGREGIRSSPENPEMQIRGATEPVYGINALLGLD